MAKPYESLHSCVEMGASVGMTLGAALAGFEPAVGVIGDSTFFHSGMPSLVGVAKCNVNANIIVMDNRIVAMTGQQPTVAENCIPNIAKSIGFSEDQIHILKPLPKYHKENVEIIEESI